MRTFRREHSMLARSVDENGREVVIPAVGRFALEMASNEDTERHAMHGELATLHTAWKESEEIAAISDELFADEVFEEFKRQYIVRQAQSE